MGKRAPQGKYDGDKPAALHAESGQQRGRPPYKQQSRRQNQQPKRQTHHKKMPGQAQPAQGGFFRGKSNGKANGGYFPQDGPHTA